MPDNVAELLRQADSAAAAQLVHLSESADKSAAKAAKRALYLLRQRGIEPPVSELHTSVSPATRTLLADRALMTNDGGTGSRMLWFVREDPYAGSPTLMTFLVNDESGVLDLAQRKTPRREMEERIETLKKRDNTAIAEVPLDYARHILSQSAGLNQRSRNPLPQGYAEAFRFIGPPDTEYSSAPVYEYIDADNLRDDQTVPRAPEKLFELPWFQGWLLELEAVEPWEAKYFEAVSSMVLIDEAQRTRRGEAVVEEAAEALLSAESVERYRRRLEDTALVLHLAGHPAEARQALYQALTFEGKTDAREVPFLRMLVQRSIFLVIAYKAELEEQAEKEQSGSGTIHRH